MAKIVKPQAGDRLTIGADIEIKFFRADGALKIDVSAPHDKELRLDTTRRQRKRRPPSRLTRRRRRP